MHVFGWPGTGFDLRFEGDRLDVDFSGSRAWIQAAWDDGESFAMDLGTSPLVGFPVPGPGPRVLRVRKRTEAMVGDLVVGAVLPGSGRILPPPPAPSLGIEFYGDSITCGYGCLDPVPEHGFQASTESFPLSWSGLTGVLLGAECPRPGHLGDRSLPELARRGGESDAFALEAGPSGSRPGLGSFFLDPARRGGEPGLQRLRHPAVPVPDGIRPGLRRLARRSAARPAGNPPGGGGRPAARFGPPGRRHEEPGPLAAGRRGREDRRPALLPFALRPGGRIRGGLPSFRGPAPAQRPGVRAVPGPSPGARSRPVPSARARSFRRGPAARRRGRTSPSGPGRPVRRGSARIRLPRSRKTNRATCGRKAAPLRVPAGG
jgi:hypothetical protein